MAGNAATTPGMGLSPLSQCFLNIPGYGQLTLDNLPDISDSKSANYQDEPALGRATPIKTYAHSDNRTLSITFYFFVQTTNDPNNNLAKIKALQSCVYPRIGSGSTPYLPPPIVSFKCGQLITSGTQSGNDGVCLTMKQYDVKYNREYVWDPDTYCPYLVEMSTTWDVVYSSDELPNQLNILQG